MRLYVCKHFFSVAVCNIIIILHSFCVRKKNDPTAFIRRMPDWMSCTNHRFQMVIRRGKVKNKYERHILAMMLVMLMLMMSDADGMLLLFYLFIYFLSRSLARS